MLFEKVKNALRLDDSYLDEEIEDLIQACLKDLAISGVEKINEDDVLIARAVITYCRANFDPTNSDYDRFTSSYEMLKQHLCLCGEYSEVAT